MKKTITNQYQSKVPLKSYKFYESRGDRNKNLSVKQYIYKTMQHLHDMINDHKPNKKNLKYGKFKYLCV